MHYVTERPSECTSIIKHVTWRGVHVLKDLMLPRESSLVVRIKPVCTSSGVGSNFPIVGHYSGRAIVF